MNSNPTRQEVFELIKKEVGRQLELSDDELRAITEETRFIEDLEVDSLDFVELAMTAEQAIAEATGLNMVELTDRELDQMTTVKATIDVILEKIRKIVSE